MIVYIVIMKSAISTGILRVFDAKEVATEYQEKVQKRNPAWEVTIYVREVHAELPGTQAFS